MPINQNSQLGKLKKKWLIKPLKLKFKRKKKKKRKKEKKNTEASNCCKFVIYLKVMFNLELAQFLKPRK